MTIKSPVPFIFTFYDRRMVKLFTGKMSDGIGERSVTFDMSMLTYPTFANVEVISSCSRKNFGIYQLKLLGGDVYKILLETEVFPMYWQGWGRAYRDGAPIVMPWRIFPPSEESDEHGDTSTRGDWVW